jgi:hypothetical protein
MSKITGMLHELRNELIKIVFLDTFLDSIIVFLSFYLFFVLINLRPIVAIAPGIFAFFFIMRRKIETIKLKSVEDKNPQMSEMLRTAADNVDKDNVMIRLLDQEVLQKMRTVATSSFMNVRLIMYKLLSISGIFVVTLYIASTNLHIINATEMISSFGMPDKLISLDDKGLYGDEDIVSLSDESVDLELNPLSFELNLDKVQEAEKKEFGGEFPEEIIATPEKAFEESIPKEEQEIVKNYFEKIHGK